LNEDLIAELEARQTIRERPFRSDVPIVGPLIAWFRTAWNSVSTRWFVLPLLQQQNEFNALMVAYLRRLERALDERLRMSDERLRTLDERLRTLDERLINLDRDQTSLTRNVAELTYQLIRMNRLLITIETQLKGQDTYSPED